MDKKQRNDAFLISRIPTELKEAILRKAALAKQTISEYVREQFSRIVSE